MSDDTEMSNVEFAKMFQGKLQDSKPNGPKPKEAKAEADPEEIGHVMQGARDHGGLERQYVPQSCVPWDHIDESIKGTLDGDLHAILIEIRTTPAQKRGRGKSIPVDVTDAQWAALVAWVGECVKTRRYTFIQQKAMQRFAGLL